MPDADTDARHPADRLDAEHQVMLAVLDAIDVECARVRSERSVRAAFWRDALDFLFGFVVASHVPKETIVFDAMAAAGYPRRPGPIADAEAEHDDERELLEQLGAAVSAGEPAALARAARNYTWFSRAHVAREDHVVLELARQVVRGADARRTAGELSRFDRNVAGAERLENLDRLARRLCAEVGVDFAQRRTPTFDSRGDRV